MRLVRYALAAALAAIPALAPAQQPDPAQTPAVTAVSPVERLLERRAELGLTQEQVRKLEVIRQTAAERERPLLERIRTERGFAAGVPIRTQAATPAERRALRERMRADPARQQLRQLHAESLHQARAVLTPEQSARAWRLGGGPGLRAAGPAPGPGMGRGPAARGASPGMGMRGAGPGRAPAGGVAPAGRGPCGLGLGRGR